MSDLMSRIERLEKSNRRLRVAACGFPALFAVAMLLGAGEPRLPPDGKFRYVTAERIVVGGADGKPGLVLTAEKANGLDLAMVQIVGGDGNTRASLGHIDGRLTKLVIIGADGAKTELRASEKAGGTSIELTPAGSKESSIELKTGRDGGAGGLRVKSPENGSWARIVYNEKGAFVDTDEGASLRPAAHEVAAEVSDEDSLDADVQETNDAAGSADKAKQEQNEKYAAAKLRSAENFLNGGNRASCRSLLKDLITKYPDTDAAKKASKMLNKTTP